MVSNNKTIAKNTLLLYFRMLVTMTISLYTSRVILQILGVDDYGIYQSVGGIVGFLSFVNNALATGSSRFITFGIGEGNLLKLEKIFSTVLTAHIVLASVIVLFAETVGLWFLYNKMVIPSDRIDAAVYTYHLSIFTAFFTLTQVPYNASIIAHERMNVFAFVSVVDAIARLLIVYALSIGNFDRLVLYSTLLCLLQIGIIIFYRFYCRSNFPEARFRFLFEKKIFKEIASFSGWSLFGSSAFALNNQGALVLLNLFFSPAVVAARAITIQVSVHANQLVSNFQTAAVPQIVKRYAAKDYEGSKHLLLNMARYSYYIMLAMSLPIFLVAEELLTLWLGVVPEYTIIFLQIIILQCLFQVFDTTFYYALYAKGRLRENALLSPTLLFIIYPVIYYLFKLGYSPIALSWASLLAYAFLGLVVKPILIIRICNYYWRDIVSVFVPCIKVTAVSLPIPLFSYYLLHSHNNMFYSFLSITMVSVVSVICASWYVGIDMKMREMIIKAVRSKIHWN